MNKESEDRMIASLAVYGMREAEMLRTNIAQFELNSDFASCLKIFREMMDRPDCPHCPPTEDEMGGAIRGFSTCWHFLHLKRKDETP